MYLFHIMSQNKTHILEYSFLPKNRIQVEKKTSNPFLSSFSYFFLSSDSLVIQLKKMHLICLDASISF